jgi:hypothetical protein
MSDEGLLAACGDDARCCLRSARRPPTDRASLRQRSTELQAVGQQLAVKMRDLYESLLYY